MYPSILALPFPNAGPEVRVFFVRYLEKIGYDTTPKDTKLIAEELDVTANVVTKSLNYLSNNGYLNKQLRGSDKGRKPSSYKLELNLQGQISGVGASQYELFIDDLLKIDSGRRSKRRHALNLSCRLLMAILLNYADEFGIVEGLGLGELSKLTGMNKDRLDSNFAILKSMGYVRSHVTGITCGYLFGKRPRIYVLNIRHASFTQGVKFCLTTIDPFVSVGDIGVTELDKAYALVGAIRTYAKRASFMAQLFDEYGSILGCGDSFVEIMGFFKDRDWRYRSYFQAKLEKYASILLSNHWGALLENGEVEKDQLISSIKSEFIYLRTGKEKAEKKESEEKKIGAFKGRAWVHPKVTEADESAEDAKMMEFSEEQYDLLVDFIYTAGWYLAKRVQGMLITAHKESGYRSLLHEMTHRIVPYSLRHRRRFYIIVDSYHRDEHRSMSSCYLVTNIEGKAVAKKSSLSLEDQYKCGLLTKPNIKAASKPAVSETK